MRTTQPKQPSASALAWVLGVALMILIVASGVQAYQLSSLQGKVSQAVERPSPSAPVSASGASSEDSASKLASNLNNLPQMVGGC